VQITCRSFETPEGSTRAVLFAHTAYKDMDSRDRVRACYLHACLRYVERDPMTNASLRERFGIAAENSAMVTRVMKEAVAQELVKPFDPEQGRRHAKYVPFWA
jgi:ATP-dependent DNA helicase RecG